MTAIIPLFSAIALFWVAIGTTLYCYAGYPLVLWIAKQFRRKQAQTQTEPTFPDVTLIVAAYNEEQCVEQKMQNTLALQYPPEKLRIMWVIDGSTDRTSELLAQYPQVTTLHQPQRLGKTAAINRAMEQVQTPVAVLCDANTHLSPDAILHIVSAFADPQVGCVAGEKRVARSAQTTEADHTEGAYWRYESLLKSLESDTGATLSAAGELLALRTALFAPMPPNTILDDFELSMNIAMGGHRVVYCPQAWATESGSANLDEEWKRKVRIAAGGFQQLCRRWRLLVNPLKNSALWFKFVSHKLLRWAVVPLCLIIVPIANVAIVALTHGQSYSTSFTFVTPIPNINIVAHVHTAFYQYTLALTAAALMLALAGFALRHRKPPIKWLHLPYYMLMANVAQLTGMVRWLTGKQDVRWQKAQRNTD
ncbi:MAG: glycosyltransferase family 2 protein [Bacteroidales bacterium]|nr:glycosyltransferase family 2 protein [Bacteroidales bacterium]